MVHLREFETQGEGAVSNSQQVIEVIVAAEGAGERVPTALMIDDACSTITHLMVEIVAFARGKELRHQPGWALLLLLSMDILVDGFHREYQI